MNRKGVQYTRGVATQQGEMWVRIALSEAQAAAREGEVPWVLWLCVKAVSWCVHNRRE